MSKTRLNIGSVISFILLLCLVAAIIVSAVFLLQKCDAEPVDNTPFRVEFDGKDYTGERNYITFPKDSDAVFKLKGKYANYGVIVTPSVTDETDFVYTVDSERHWYGQTNISDIFITKDNLSADSFKIPFFDRSLLNVLRQVYPSRTVKLDETIAQFPYLLTVTSDDKKVISFVFGFEDVVVTDITLSAESITL